MGYILLSVALVALDQGLKLWASAQLTLHGAAVPLLGSLLGLRLTHNFGAAWSSFSGQRLLLIALPAVIVAAVVVLAAKKIVRHPLGKLACALIAAGGIGNLIDRVAAGYVVDMLYFPFWTSYPTFNLADVCIVLGAVMGSVYYLRFYEAVDRVRKEERNGDDLSDGER